MPDEAFIVLTKGSRYRLVSVETREKPMVSHGIFRGYAAIGPDDAICLELDESHKDMAGRVRLIPCHMVLSIDVVDQVKAEARPSEEPKPMYG